MNELFYLEDNVVDRLDVLHIFLGEDAVLIIRSIPKLRTYSRMWKIWMSRHIQTLQVKEKYSLAAMKGIFERWVFLSSLQKSTELIQSPYVKRIRIYISLCERRSNKKDDIEEAILLEKSKDSMP